MKKILFLGVILLLNACIIEEHIHFEENFSGYSTWQMDLSPLVAKIENPVIRDTIGFPPEMKTTWQEIIALIRKQEGIEEAQLFFDRENHTMKYLVHFESLAALNQVYTTLEEYGKSRNPEAKEYEANAFGSFELVDNVLIFRRFSSKDNSPVLQGEIDSLLNQSRTTQISFAREIDYIKAKNIEVRQSDSTVTFSLNTQELLDLKEAIRLEIVFK